MKKINNLIFALCMVCIITAVGTSCKKENYLTDGGVSTASTPLSTYDYLKANRYHYFDTTLLLIDHFNLKDSVNKAGTFFAFTDFSVNRLMNSLGYTSLDSLYAHITSKFITQYLFSDTITLNNVTTSPRITNNWAGTTAPSAISKVQGTYGINLNNTSPSFSYFTLQYIKINGVLDGSVNAPPNDLGDAIIPCQTTGIMTSVGGTLKSNGSILNVLSNVAGLNIL